MSKRKELWGVMGADGLCLTGPRLADEVFESLNEAFQEAGQMIQDGIYQEIEIAPCRLNAKEGYWYDAGSRNRIQIDARDFEMPDED